MTMSPAPVSNPNSIWREAFRIPRRHLNDLIPAIMISFAVMTILIYFAAGMVIQLVGSLATIKGNGGGVPSFPSGIIPLYFGFILVVTVQWFYFIVYFSKRELKRYGQPELGVGRFFYSFGMRLLVMLIIMCVMFVGIALSAIVGAVLGKSGISSAVSALLMFAAQLVYYFLLIRFILVGVLAANKIKPVLDTSWKLSQGNWWRLLGTLLLVSILIDLAFIPFGIIGGILMAVMHRGGGGSSGFVALLSVGIGLLITVIMVIYAGYETGACRILIDEKRQSDPAFLRMTESGKP